VVVEVLTIIYDTISLGLIRMNRITNDTLMKRLEMMFDGYIPILINRIANEFSHLTFIERAWKPFEIPELEEVVNLIFDKMKEIDERQFTALLESCK